MPKWSVHVPDDWYLIQGACIESGWQFVSLNLNFPFVSKGKLKIHYSSVL